MLDDFLPDYDVHEVHSTTVAAAPEAIVEAIRELTAREVPLLVALMALRSGPRVLRLSVRRRVLEQFERAGFVPLRESPDGLVYGGVGRFWRASGGLRRIEPSEFAGFAEPGYAKAAFSFELERRGDRALLTTETRVLATDDRARRRFRRYWRVIHPGSAAIRIAWLRAIRRRAERGDHPRRARRAASAATTHSPP
ncbi:MAG: hypothetical protein ACRDN8_17785, partial [Thermoleophilaceae bacterium]